MVVESRVAQLLIAILEIDPDHASGLVKVIPSLVRLMRNLLSTGFSSEYDVAGVTDPFLQVRHLDRAGESQTLPRRPAHWGRCGRWQQWPGDVDLLPVPWTCANRMARFCRRAWCRCRSLLLGAWSGVIVCWECSTTMSHGLVAVDSVKPHNKDNVAFVRWRFDDSSTDSEPIVALKTR